MTNSERSMLRTLGNRVIRDSRDARDLRRISAKQAGCRTMVVDLHGVAHATDPGMINVVTRREGDLLTSRMTELLYIDCPAQAYDGR